ncbi:MAG: rubrerythrin family protein [Candidatus Portnoybacteria bacterium CG10_big_fil_rev_8_21_14_0_10_36_7]|uniref:Rubrerythrin family protein n=1 Tax=Candidatus Portnoybacteria bacterium CG10_big_fil_rev_8_21_14_0_10_36_7 TaxID=1974812 RepID=A0A2M8KES0_9BACT|nr:MAG: rubrerythrin family protein [Candidatus Portnoybacteria bacterium CG10_big_fil_rev_8_21_14_0_10_36_7]
MKKTIQNLTKSFIGESQARNRYDFYSKIAKKEGYEQIAAIFIETAEQEKTHAKRLFEHIQELLPEADQLLAEKNEIKVEAGMPTVYGKTIENLKAAINGENYEHTKMYPEFAKVAEEEELPDIARRLRSIAKAEEHHEERYKKLLAQVEAGAVFKKSQETSWVCRECGYIHFGLEAPEKCPSCDHPQAYYQVQCENY